MKSGGKELALQLEESGYAGLGIEDDEEAVGKRMTAVAEQIGNWLAAFTEQAAAEPWLQALREAAFQRFSELGFPTTHDEEWRFTNVAPIARTGFCSRIGRLGVTLRAGCDAGTSWTRREPTWRSYAAFDRNAFVALNTAFLTRCSAVHRVPRGAVIEEPIQIIYDVAKRDAHGHRTRAP